MRRAAAVLAVLATTVAGLVTTGGPAGARPGDRGGSAARRAPDGYDALAAAPARRPSTPAQRAALRAATRPGTTPQVQAQLGVPTTLFARRSGPVPSGSTPAEAARLHLARLADVYGLSRSDIARTPVLGVHDLGHGPVVVQLGQQVDGVPVIGERLAVVMTQSLRLVGLTGYLVPPHVVVGRRSLGAADAVAAAYRDLTGRTTAPRPVAGLAGHDRFVGPGLTAPALARPVLYRLPAGLVSAYDVVVRARSGGEDLGYRYVVGAADGRVLQRADLVAEDNTDVTYRVWTAGSDGRPYPPQGPTWVPDPSGQPDGQQPDFGSPSLVHGPVTGDPWLASDASTSQGNNVDAYTDVSQPDGFTPASSDTRASMTSAGSFDRVYDLGQDPQASNAQAQAAVTQLFYDVNYLHDWFYGAGFDEAAGNAQESNYGRGGLGGDPIDAEDQDYSGVNNANMYTPPDGESPRMQMYRWSGPSNAGLTLTPGGARTVGLADFGAQSFDVTAPLVALTDLGGTSATDGCESAVTDVGNKIAVVDRGNCSFQTKSVNAQAAGAVGLVVINSVSGGPNAMGCSGACPGSLTIGTVSISQADGAALRSDLGSKTVTGHLVRVTATARDGALDATVVSHEWGHYLSFRLVPAISLPQPAALSEGWGDFVSLLLMVQPEDLAHLDGAFPTGAFASALFSHPDEYYFGIRRVPYSTDLAKDAFTFRDITDGQALPDVPMNVNGGANSEVHNAGEIWATMLWECYAALLGDATGDAPRLSFEQAQTRMKEYLVAALRATPADPTYLEARDALLMVAAASDHTDFELFASAFAKRGAGNGAVAPARDSDDFSGVVESDESDFEAPDQPTVTALPRFTAAPSMVVHFSATDAGSGVATYAVQQRQATWTAAGLPVDWTDVATTATPSYTAGLARGTTACFRVVATDVAGNTGVASAQRCTSRLVDDTSLKRSSGWRTVRGKAYDGGSASTTTQRSRSLTLGNVHESALALRATTCRTCGSVTVYLGSRKLRTVSLVSSATRPAVLLTVPLSSPVSGTLRIVTTSAKPVTVDGVGVSQG
ncbi:M36 family metallopeptidase [Nocardioides sp.]|uniref:M36 family metallopeptidase n=1 Tax=Nocardioides sp. TaxID=35761 RepID=UPI0037843364